MNKFEKLSIDNLAEIRGGVAISLDPPGYPTGGSPEGGVCYTGPSMPGTGPCMHWGSDWNDEMGGIEYNGVYFTGNPC